jgi:phosphoribosylformylglycinamidine synthase subunit PurQ / glutaminase
VKPTVNILYTPGTNSHQETIYAFERVGATANLLMLRDVLNGSERLDGADILCIPGGFSYGDHLGAGSLAGQFIRHKLADQLQAARQKPIIAICNGFQIAVRAGLFGPNTALDINESGTFRNLMRQPHVVENEVKNVWLDGLDGQTLRFPCAHGEGRLTWQGDIQWRPALRYPDGTNPDGSADNVGGISSPDGLVFGLMDHPERYLDGPGNLDIFANGVKAAA